MTLVIERVVLELQRLKTGISLLFAASDRPDVDAIARALASVDDTVPSAAITHRPDPAEGWLELLTNGLTFELCGLAPAAAVPVTLSTYRFGSIRAASPSDLEAVALVAGPHISGGRALEPVVRAMTGLAASLALSLPVHAVCWEPARIWMEPRYFVRLVVGWLAGGPFPALGLTAVEAGPDGLMRSRGLDYFLGQEIEIVPGVGEPPADTVKLAVRVIDNLIRRGRIERRTEFDSSSDHRIIAEPSADLTRVRVWRAG